MTPSTWLPVARLALAALLSASTYLASVALMGTSAWLIARAAQHPDASTLTLAAVAVRSLALARALLRYAERLVGHDAVLRAAAALRVSVFDGLRCTPARQEAATDVSVVVSDVDAVHDLWLRALLPFAAAVLVAVASGVALAVALPSAAAVLLLAQGCALVLLPVVGWWAASRDQDLAQVKGEQQAAAVDLLHGAAELLVLGGTDRAVARAEAAGEQAGRLERASARRSALLGALLLALQGSATLGVALLGAAAVRRDALDPVTSVVLVLVALASFEPVLAVADGAGVLRRSVGALHRVRALLRAAGEPGASVAGGAQVLELAGIVHRYPGRSTSALRLHDLRLRLLPGTALGVVGGSGAGKSTLLRLLSGELGPVQGEVRAGARALADLSSEDRARLVSIAAQDAHVFDATVADNLLVGRPTATAPELVQVLAAVGLGSWLSALPEGLATPLGHRGARMSGGERKRLCVARALLSDAPVLLLDEPTEGLEPEAADALLASVLDVAHDRAVVVVTHRVAATESLDEVLVLDRGVLSARGTAAALRARPGLFRDAWILQACQPEEVAA